MIIHYHWLILDKYLWEIMKKTIALIALALLSGVASSKSYDVCQTRVQAYFFEGGIEYELFNIANAGQQGVKYSAQLFVDYEGNGTIPIISLKAGLDTCPMHVNNGAWFPDLEPFGALRVEDIWHLNRKYRRVLACWLTGVDEHNYLFDCK